MTAHSAHVHYAQANDKCQMHVLRRYVAAMDTPAERLKSAREKAGFVSAMEAAAAMNISYNSYAQYENGTRGISAKNAERFARRYKVTASWLLYGKDDVALPGEGPQLLLSVSLPTHDRLTRMMRGLLEGVGLSEAADQHASVLARRLPDALALAASDGGPLPNDPAAN